MGLEVINYSQDVRLMIIEIPAFDFVRQIELSASTSEAPVTIEITGGGKVLRFEIVSTNARLISSDGINTRVGGLISSDGINTRIDGDEIKRLFDSNSINTHIGLIVSQLGGVILNEDFSV